MNSESNQHLGIREIMDKHMAVGRRISRLGDDIIIKEKKGFCDLVVIIMIVICTLSLISGPPLMAVVVAPKIKVSVCLYLAPFTLPYN